MENGIQMLEEPLNDPVAMAAAALPIDWNTTNFPPSRSGPEFNTRTPEEWRALDRERAEKRARRKARKLTEGNKGNEVGKLSLPSFPSVKTQ
jgi:hypothetical protein